MCIHEQVLPPARLQKDLQKEWLKAGGSDSAVLVLQICCSASSGLVLAAVGRECVLVRLVLWVSLLTSLTGKQSI